MQHVVGVTQRHTFIGCLQTGTHTGDGAVVVHALDVDGAGVTTLPFGQVVGHVRHKVGVAAVAFFHHAVFVVTIVGGLEPQGTILLVGFAGCLQPGDGCIDLARAVQAGLKVIVVEAHRESLQVQILLMAKVGHGKLANRVHVFNITRRSVFTVIGLDSLFGQEVGGDISYVLAVVKSLAGGVVRVSRPALVTWLEAFGPQLGAGGQGVDLHTGIVVIKLAVHLCTLGFKQVADRIAQRRLAAMADMQGAGRVGRNKLNHHARPAGRGFDAKLGPGQQHFAHGFLLGSGFQADIDKTRPGNFNRIDPGLKGWLRFKQGLEGFGDLAWILFQALGQLHCSRAGKVTMGSHLGGFKRGFFTRTWRELFKPGGQRSEQISFYREHGPILRLTKHGDCPGRLARFWALDSAPADD